MLRALVTFEKLMYLAVLSLYTVFAAVLLVYFGATIVWTMLVLSVVPIIVLWRLERLDSALLAVVSLVAIGVTIALESTAYINGIWYETSPSEWRLFDLIPAEAFLATFVHILYFLVVYEYFFDDGKTSGRRALRRWPLVTLAAAVLFAAGVSYVYLFSGLIISSAFAFVLVAILLLAAGASILQRGWSTVTLVKAALFSVALLPVTLAYEYVALSNNLRFFANLPDYLYTFTIGGQFVPLEELVFVLLIPAVTAFLYELYLDDAR